MTATRTRLWRRGFSPLGVLVFAVMVPLVMMTVAAFLFGWRFQPVETGSMAPRFPVGSLAVVEPIDPADVEAGTVIVFVDPNDRSRLIAHRAVERLDMDPPAWRTQGDANASVDAFPVASRDIVGRVRWGAAGVRLLVGRIGARGVRPRRQLRRRGAPGKERGANDDRSLPGIHDAHLCPWGVK